MGRVQGAGDRPEDEAQAAAEAVSALAALWARAPQAVTPRVSAHQLRALHAVGRGHEVNLTRLAEQMGVSLSTASRLCDRLEAAGFLERGVPPSSRREVCLTLTDGGRRLVAQVAECRRRHLAAVLESMPAEGRAALLNGLHAFHAAWTVTCPPRPEDGT